MKRRRSRTWTRLLTIAVAALIMAILAPTISAQDDAVTAETVTALQVSLDTTWVLITAFLVFFMQCGFAMLEAGFIRHTGVVNALLENFMDAGLTGLAFWAVGFGIAFGTSSGGLFGTSNFFLSDAVSFVDGSVVYGGDGLSIFTLFFFQFAFAATASTIATGGMAERTDFIGDVIYSIIAGAIIYPVVVHWIWGGGWLAERGFFDFAGSTVVHTVGGVLALVGAIMLGPRAGRVFGEMPKPHNLGLATLGTMILWFGWYGFNPGSTLGMGDPGLTGLVTVNTTLAACAGTIAAMFFMFARTGKWDLGITLNGSLAGLVAITAGCAFVAPWASVVIGAIAGVLVILVVDLIESLKIDDPVGAFAVHGACGIFGTLMIGIVGQPELMGGSTSLLIGGGLDVLVNQFIGSAATIIWVTVTSVIVYAGLKAIGRLRVDPKADEVGIDVYEHGASVWPDILPIPEEVIIVEGGD
ncbi:ammonium transporter [Phototrophicus methaneseepsis]|uniref:Ammonium transporter n=1 Tax=Phototrophicus methaneseepsis TaxID=2710758 RepID=A0A7S8IGY2_9CHLR|nr:ammonium transporter [Phototrophicus methaneseepsis]QPC84613.1 ammonium transporter [Phototrophicus methaneseepsis]